MNLYSNKQRWKILLLVIAIVMVALSLIISNQIVQQVAKREKDRITHWADAIRKKADLVNLTNNTFDELREKERQKVELWGKATRELGKPSLNNNIDYTFLLDIIQENKDIPVVVTDLNGNPINYINLSITKDYFIQQSNQLTPEEVNKLLKDSIRKLTLNWEKSHTPFEIEVYKGIRQRFYYHDSKKLGYLEKQRDSLIQAFNTELIDNQSLVPVLFINKENRSVIETNIDSIRNYRGNIYPNETQFIRTSKDSIQIAFQDYLNGVIYYDESPELIQLKWFPYIQFGVIGLFIIIGYLVFSTYRKAEQNQVWAGLAKETAHQLGTPISSLMAWVQLLETQNIDKEHLGEMNKDIDRLTLIADRFSKIGSGSKLTNANVVDTVQNVLNYLHPRISSQVSVAFKTDNEEYLVPHNAALLEWVIENIIKNAVDAMDGKGSLQVHLSELENSVFLDIADSGKGISPKHQKTIFEPGFTTKQRGWGLGLSLAKRIINTYHKGKIFVLKSELEKGTTFRIILNKN